MMGRILIAIVLGLIVAFAVSAAAEALASGLFPVASGDDLLNGFSLGGHAGPIPNGAKAILVAGWGLGTLLGGGVADRIGHREIDAYVVAAIVVAAAMAHASQFVQPSWMIPAGLLLPWICAWAVRGLAHRFARR
jgi:hypothetical protein